MPSSTPRYKSLTRSDGKGFAGIGPLEGVRQVLVEVLDELQKPLAQFLRGGKAGPFEQAADQDAEPDFDLIQPGSMFGRIDEADAMAGICQKRLAGGHGSQDAAFAFDAQVVRQVAGDGDPAHQAFRLMSIDSSLD